MLGSARGRPKRKRELGMPAITVIMPAYRAERTVEWAIRSTLKALPDDGRILIRDDGSDDGTAAAVLRIRDVRVRLLQGENLGVAGGLQALLAEVETPLVARMDADDLCLPYRFKVQLARLSRGADVVFGTVVPMTDQRAVASVPMPVGIGVREMPMHLLIANSVPHATLAARISALAALGGYRDSPAEDYDLWLRLTAAQVPVARHWLPVIRQRQHEGQLSTGDAWKQKLRADPLIRESYAALCLRVLGMPPAWMDPLMSAWLKESPVRTPALIDFGERIQERAAELPYARREFLLRKMVQEIPALRNP